MEPTDLVSTAERYCENAENDWFTTCRKTLYPRQRRFCAPCAERAGSLHRVRRFRQRHPEEGLRDRLIRGALLPIAIVHLWNGIERYWLVSSRCPASGPAQRIQVDRETIDNLGELQWLPRDLLAPIKKLLIFQHDRNSPVKPSGRMRPGYHILAFSPYAYQWLDAAFLHREQFILGRLRWQTLQIAPDRFRAILYGEPVPELPPMEEYHLAEPLDGWRPRGIPFPFEGNQRETARLGIQLLAGWRDVVDQTFEKTYKRYFKNRNSAVG